MIMNQVHAEVMREQDAQRAGVRDDEDVGAELVVGERLRDGRDDAIARRRRCFSPPGIDSSMGLAMKRWYSAEAPMSLCVCAFPAAGVEVDEARVAHDAVAEGRGDDLGGLDGARQRRGQDLDDLELAGDQPVAQLRRPGRDRRRTAPMSRRPATRPSRLKSVSALRTRKSVVYIAGFRRP